MMEFLNSLTRPEKKTFFLLLHQYLDRMLEWMRNIATVIVNNLIWNLQKLHINRKVDIAWCFPVAPDKVFYSSGSY